MVGTIDHLATNLADNSELFEMRKADGDDAASHFGHHGFGRWPFTEEMRREGFRSDHHQVREFLKGRQLANQADYCPQVGGGGGAQGGGGFAHRAIVGARRKA